MSSRSLLLSSCSPSERMMKGEFHLYLYNIDGGRTMVSHRTRRREGNGGQRRKRPTAEEEDLPSAPAPLRKGGGASSLGTRGTGEGAWWRGQRGRRQGHLWRRYDASFSWFRRPEVLRVRACETDPALEERKKQAVLPALRVSAVPCRGARGLLLTLVCPAGGRLAEAPRLPL